MFYGQCWKCGERWGLGTAPTCTCKSDDDDTMCYRSELEAAVQAERKACALLTEQLGSKGYGTLAIAAAIRGRGKDSMPLFDDWEGGIPYVDPKKQEG